MYHVSKLRKYYPCLTSFADDDGNDLTPSPTLIDDTDNVEEWEVESIEGKRTVRKQAQYLVKWKGSSHWHNTWEPAYLLTNAKEAIDEYNVVELLKLLKRAD